MRLLIGIDDTDNKESRGTGFKSRQLAGLIEKQKLGKVNGISRHQLFVHDSIPYTSQNSSACLDVNIYDEPALKRLCAQYLTEEAAEGSDAGLCIANWQEIPEVIMEWGRRAKKEVLSLLEAIELSEFNNIYLEGFTGEKIGQIGALAAVGLRKDGSDGRFIWLKGTGELRDFDAGIYQVGNLKNSAGIDLIQTLDGISIPDNEMVNCEGWTRPVLIKDQAVLFVEKTNFAQYGWKTIGKEYIRTIS